MSLPALAPERPTAPPSGAARNRLVAGLVVLAVILFLAAVASLALGSKPLALGTVWRVLLDNDGSDAAIIIHELRVPRTILGVLVGIALGMAGTLMQGHTRNPLAEPALLG